MKLRLHFAITAIIITTSQSLVIIVSSVCSHKNENSIENEQGRLMEFSCFFIDWNSEASKNMSIQRLYKWWLQHLFIAYADVSAKEKK